MSTFTKTLVALSLALILGVASTSSASAQEKADGKEVIFQGFNWPCWGLFDDNGTYWYEYLEDKAVDLGASGIDAVWLPPPSKANDMAKQGYLPSELNNLSSAYGDKALLQSLITALHSNGVKAIADIVINHRVGTTTWADFTNPTWGCNAVCSGDEWTGACGSGDTGAGYTAARDIDHTNTTVRTDIKAWMTMLKTEVGFDGWRYDYVKGFSGSYVKEYNTHTSPWFVVGEVWEPYDVMVAWLNATNDQSKAFDFVLKGTMHDAFNNGNLGLLNAYGKMPSISGTHTNRSVTFIDNHDTGSTQNHWPFPTDHVMEGYAYILTHPATPCVFFDHFYDWNEGALHDPIKELILIRKENNIGNSSVLNIVKSEASLYAAVIDDKVAMKIGSGSWSPTGSDWALATSGTNYAVWTKAAAGAPVVSFNPAAGHYASAQTITISATDNTDPNPRIYYTTDGSTPTTSSTNALSPVSFSLSSDATVKAFAKDAGGVLSEVVSATYTIGDVTGFTAHFKNTSWTTPKIWFWGVLPTGAVTEPSDWVNRPALIPESDGWFKYEFPAVTSTNLLFNDGTTGSALGVNQTGDLKANADCWYDWSSETNFTNDQGVEEVRTGWLKIPTATSVNMTGTLRAGQTLTGTYTYNHASSTAEGLTTFKWYRANDINGNGATVVATRGTDTYTLTAADKGKYIAFAVIPEDTKFVYGKEVRSAYQGPVQDGVGVEDVKTQFLIYPNPANESLSIISDERISEIVVRDISGRETFKVTPNQKSATVSVANMSDGVYFISCKLANVGTQTQKLIIKH